MVHPAFCRDGKKLHLALVGASQHFEAIAFNRLGCHQARDMEEADALTGHDFRQGSILEFPDDPRLDALAAEPFFQVAAQCRILGGEEGGGLVAVDLLKVAVRTAVLRKAAVPEGGAAVPGAADGTGAAAAG